MYIMGLSVKATGLSENIVNNWSYSTFNEFMIVLANTYNEEFGVLYNKLIYDKLTEEEFARFNELSNNDLNIFLLHSDCDGKLTSIECEKIYNSIKDLNMDMFSLNPSIKDVYNMLDNWKSILKHCYENKINLYFC